MKKEIEVAVAEYGQRVGRKPLSLKAALIDMDGVLYDTMRYHTLAWKRMMDEIGVDCDRDEFYLYEGMTGAATINHLIKREWNRQATPEEVKELYGRKSRYFKEYGIVEKMPGAEKMLAGLRDADVTCVLVTGSAQNTVLDKIDIDYPGSFEACRRVTAHDVTHGKPSAEPYLKGLELAGVKPYEAIVVENAPLGVRAGVAAGVFTVAVTTGPIPRKAFEDEKADLIFPSMSDFAEWLPTLIKEFHPMV